MKRYQILPHTADLRLRVYGEDREELFRHGAYGLAKLLKEDIDKNSKYIRGFEKVDLKSKDTSTLLVDFLNEILTLSNIEKKVYPKTKILKISSTEVKAHISGFEVNGFDRDLKAVSYHAAEIEEREDGRLQATVVLDI